MRLSAWLPLVLAAIALAAAGLASPGRVTPRRLRAQAQTVTPIPVLTARRLRTRSGAIRPGTVVRRSAVFGQRVFSNDLDGFALANGNQAQYPAVTVDGGRSWRIAGPQFHVDAADAPEAVGYVGMESPRTLYAYGSSVVDVTANAGRTWWETFMGELVMAVVRGPAGNLVAYVQQSVSNTAANPAVTWQYVSRDGGRHWHYSSALGG
ncbi:MAG: hypothetical protein JO244_04545 [Solirubrobacterales bacterium]|nr:hypothetical protein [Solirubrobacterales bacterium]